jgi:hypothetical protein
MTTIDLVPDQLWNVIQPLLPPEPPKPKGGRPRIPDMVPSVSVETTDRTTSWGNNVQRQSNPCQGLRDRASQILGGF